MFPYCFYFQFKIFIDLRLIFIALAIRASNDDPLFI